MRIASRRDRVQRIGSAAFTFVAVGLLVLAILWPRVVAETLPSRLAVLLIAIWSGGFALLLNPELSAAMVQGIREFRKALEDVIREIRGDK
jgi:hypothetical protein